MTAAEDEVLEVRAPRRLGVLNGLLGIVVLALVVYAVLVLAKGASVVPGESQAEKTTDQYAAVIAAGRAETLAFLKVDYKDMDPLIARVLKGATGTFRSQYESSKVELKAQTEQAESVSSGTVRQIGIGDLTASTATLFVAADSEVSNKATKGVNQPRYYRIQLSMVRKGSAWLLSDLQFVG